MDPERRVEEAVVEQLLQQEVRVVGGARHEVLGQLQEGLKQQQQNQGCRIESLDFFEGLYRVRCLVCHKVLLPVFLNFLHATHWLLGQKAAAVSTY